MYTAETLWYRAAHRTRLNGDRIETYENEVLHIYNENNFLLLSRDCSFVDRQLMRRIFYTLILIYTTSDTRLLHWNPPPLAALEFIINLLEFLFLDSMDRASFVQSRTVQLFINAIRRRRARREALYQLSSSSSP